MSTAPEGKIPVSHPAFDMLSLVIVSNSLTRSFLTSPILLRLVNF